MQDDRDVCHTFSPGPYMAQSSHYEFIKSEDWTEEERNVRQIDSTGVKTSFCESVNHAMPHWPTHEINSLETQYMGYLVCFSCLPTSTNAIDWTNWTSLDSFMIVGWFLNWVLLIVFTIQGRVGINFWRCSPVFSKHVFLRCLLFDPHETRYQSNLGVQLRQLN